VAGQVPPLLVELTWDKTTATVTVHGVVDSRTAVALICHVFEIAGTSRPECLILDLHHVSSADLAGAAAVGAIQAALDGKCLVIIRRPQPEMRRLIEITQWCADWLESQRSTGTAGAADVDRLDGLEVGWNEEFSELGQAAITEARCHPGRVRRRVGMRHHPLADLINAFIDSGLVIEHITELGERPVPAILGIQARKPSTGLPAGQGSGMCPWLAQAR
jgi:anti-anti-sigma regulatory factor